MLSKEELICRWFEKFRSGNFSLEDEEGFVHSPLINNDQVTSIIEAD